MSNDKLILLVEDNPDDEALMVRALRKNQIHSRVLVCHDGQEAIDFFFGPGAGENPTPQIVILDLKMPRVDGFEVLRRLRAAEKTRGIPVVIFSSSTEDRDIFMSYHFGASSYVRKPVDFSDFSETVRRLGTYWLKVNQASPSDGSLRLPHSPAG